MVRAGVAHAHGLHLGVSRARTRREDEYDRKQGREHGQEQERERDLEETNLSLFRGGYVVLGRRETWGHDCWWRRLGLWR
jgi:hypothetical protein